MLVAATAVGLLVPPLLGQIIDAVVAHQEASTLAAPIGWLFAVAAAASLLGGIGAVLVSRLGETMLAGLREDVVQRALGMPLAQVEAAGSGDLVARISSDVAAVAAAVRSAVPEVLGAALTIVLTVVGMFALDWRFAVAGVLAAPVQALALRWYLRRSGPVFAAERVAVGVRSQRVLDAVRGAPTVRSYGLADQQVCQVRTSARAASDLSIQANQVATRFYGRLNLAEAIGLTATLVVGFFLVGNGSATVGAAAAAALYFHRLFDPVNTFLGLFATMQEAGASVARLVGVAQAPSAPTALGPQPRDGSVVVDQVSFGYPEGPQVLHGVTIRVGPGEHVALVGPSGAGKSTLASLLAGVHPPTGGRILIGGVDVDRIDERTMRRTVYLVTQEVHVFAGTVADNLRLAVPAADDEALAECAAAVGADAWIDALPEGMATVVGEGGHALTSTEAQHLALARLVLADPAVVILDEATADAGSAGSRILERAAERALRGRTAVVVAHRLSQAAACDRVIVLEGGRVTEQGAPEDLAGGNGTYSRLWHLWAGAHTQAEAAAAYA